MKKIGRQSELTMIDYYIGLIAGITNISLSLTYIFSSNRSEQLFGLITLLEGTFALLGLVLIDMMSGNGFDLYPDQFKTVSPSTLMPFSLIILGLTSVQLLAGLPLSVKDWHKALAIIAAAPSEEIFFRGVLLSPFMKMGTTDTKLTLKSPLSEDTLISISIIEIVGILGSSFLFTLLHINYYGSPRLMVVVFVSGIILALVYQRYRDLTANILGHFLVNIIVTMQTFGILIF